MKIFIIYFTVINEESKVISFSRQWTVGSRQSAVGSGQLTVGSGQLTVCSGL